MNEYQEKNGPELKKRRMESLSSLHSLEEIKQIDWFINTFWPIPQLPARDFNESPDDYVEKSKRNILAFQSWRDWLVDELFVKHSNPGVPYYGNLLPPSSMMQARTVEYSTVPFPYGTALLVRFFTLSLIGPRGWKKATPFGMPNDKIWTHKWLTTDFHNWINDKSNRFFSDITLLQKNSGHGDFAVMEVLNSIAVNESNIPLLSGDSSVFVLDHPHMSMTTNTWGIKGVQGKKYPSSWPWWESQTKISKGIFADWPDPDILVPLHPPLLPLGQMYYPSEAIRKGFKKILNSEEWVFESLAIYDEMLSWMSKGNERCFSFLGLSFYSPEDKISPPKEWKLRVLFTMFHKYGMLMDVLAPFPFYIIPYAPQDDFSRFAEIEQKLKDWDKLNDITIPILSSNKELLETVPLETLVSASHSLGRHVVFIQTSHFDLQDVEIRKNAERAYSEFNIQWHASQQGVDLVEKGLVKPKLISVRWKVNELLEALQLSSQSSSIYLNQVRVFMDLAFISKLGNGKVFEGGSIGPESLVIPIPKKSNSNFSQWKPHIGQSPYLSHQKITDLYTLWIKDSGSWFGNLLKKDSLTTEWDVDDETDPIFVFIRKNMIYPLKERGLIRRICDVIRSEFDSESTDYMILVRHQFEAYILWCDVNSKAQSKPKYIPVGAQMNDEKGIPLVNSQNFAVLNIMPDMGIIQSEGNRTPFMIKVLGAWWSLIGDDFYGFLKGLFIETFRLLIKTLKFIITEAKEIIGNYWPVLLGVTAIVGAGFVGVKVLEKKI